MARLLWTFTALVQDPVEEISQLLAHLPPGPYSPGQYPLPLSGSGVLYLENDLYTAVSEDGHKVYIRMDAAAHTFSIQGQWWYRGVYTLLPQGAHTEIRLQVFNVARSFAWAAHLMNLGQRSLHRINFERWIGALHNRLNE